MDTYIVFWLAATVVFVLVELMTVGLTSIWLDVYKRQVVESANRAIRQMTTIILI